MTITQAIERQAARTPDAVAVISGGRSLTYRELDQRANQLARHLQKLGIQKETLVGLAVERSLEMMIALIAILKAGGAYVPMDLTYPAKRIAMIMEDSEAPLIIATERTKLRLGNVSARLVSIDGDKDEIGRNSVAPVSSDAGSQNLAYVIYTSGSTGRPKGVMVEHRNVLNFFAGMDEVIGPEPGVWLAVTSICFDISVLELFWTLARGFRAIIHDEASSHTIAEEIRNYGVTHLQSTPSMARMIAMSADGLSALGQLKKLLLGGEALPSSLVRRLRQQFHGELYNMYGPTETTVWSTTFHIRGDSEIIPIGSPIVNTQVYVLDTEFRAVLPGETGELFIGGQGVARGYWRRPELSIKRFLKDAFLLGNRMYRTGDMARFLPDGNLEFLGRADFQVKLRGFRIEIGEIEATLENHPDVAQAVVVAREFRPDDMRLVAYLVARPGRKLSNIDVRAALTATLPEYMVPSAFVVLDAIPMTANGKVDRNGLPDPLAQAREPVVPPLSSSSELESMIAKAWQEALGLHHVGINENFFDLGAHSMIVAEVHMQLQQQLRREISLVDLFQFPTVRTLAAYLSGRESAPQVPHRAQRRLAARQRMPRA